MSSDDQQNASADPGSEIMSSRGTKLEGASQQVRSHAELAGKVIAGRYSIDGLIGCGGWGNVYSGSDRILNRPVAIKLLHAHLISTDYVTRFRREAQSIARLIHQNICTVFDFGFLDDGQPYIVMEYLAGTSLKEVIRQEGRLGTVKTLLIGVQLCDALAEAHRLGIVHRDIKPENIVILKDNMPRILDFGLAKVMGDESEHDITQAGQSLGTPRYMSPEQCKGLTVDGASDIYSLGCVLFEMLTGKPPFEAATSFELMCKHVDEKAPALQERSSDEHFPPALCAAIDKALSKDPSERFGSASAFKQQLEAVLHKSKASSYDLSHSLSKRRGVLVVLAALTAVLCISTVAFYAALFLPKRFASRPISALAKVGIKVSGGFADAGQARWDVSLCSTGANDEDIDKALGSGTNRVELLGTKVTDRGLDALDKVSNLKELCLRYTNVSDKGLKKLAKYSSLQGLYLSFTHVDDDGMSTLAGLSNLHRLALSGTEISDDGLADLSPLKQLESLQLDHTGISDLSMDTISKFKNLKELSIRQTALTGSSLQKLPRGLTVLQLSNLRLQDNDLVSLAGMNQLEELGIDDNPLTDSSLLTIGSLHGLKKITISGTKISDQGFELLSALPNLVSLTANNLKLTDKGFARLVDMKTLKSLELSGSGVSDDALKQISYLPLAELDVSNNKISDQGLAYIAKISSLRSLSLSNTHVTADGLKQLSLLPHLKALEIKGLPLNQSSVSALKKALPGCAVECESD